MLKIPNSNSSSSSTISISSDSNENGCIENVLETIKTKKTHFVAATCLCLSGITTGIVATMIDDSTAKRILYGSTAVTVVTSIGFIIDAFGFKKKTETTSPLPNEEESATTPLLPGNTITPKI